MIYRYVEHDGENGIDRGVKRPKSIFWHPFGSINHECFDASQVFTDIKDWKGCDTSKGQFRTVAVRVKATGRNTQPTNTFIEPVLAELKSEIERGWRTCPSKYSSHLDEELFEDS